jgi:hypothetical protein
MLCSLVDMCSLHLQGKLRQHVPLRQWKIYSKLRGITSQMTVTSKDIAMRTSNSTPHWHLWIQQILFNRSVHWFHYYGIVGSKMVILGASIRNLNTYLSLHQMSRGQDGQRPYLETYVTVTQTHLGIMNNKSKCWCFLHFPLKIISFCQWILQCFYFDPFNNIIPLSQSPLF